MNLRSPPDEKIACFRRLFRGRRDVYPQRFDSKKTGKAGYSPACANEWIRGICEKPRIKCANCPNQSWLPVEDWTVRWHLSGKDSDHKPFVMGLYPMLPDDSCYLLAIDLDGAGWQDDATALKTVLKQQQLPIALERSRSGKGAHLWLFFEEAIPASIARSLGTFLLSEAMNLRPEIGLASYDRMFPNQDTLPKGGFGNLIALPLQQAAREQGNTLFLDDDLQPWPDQWAFLGTLPQIQRATVEALVQTAARSHRTLPVRAAPSDSFTLQPWTAPPSRRTTLEPINDPPELRIDIVLADEIYVPKSALAPVLQNRILHLAAFQNPEFYKAQAMRLPTFDKPRIIACAEIHPEHIALPRGCLEELRRLLHDNQVRYRVIDRRTKGSALKLTFRGQLRPEQHNAAQALLKHDTGVLAATTAFGKTVLAAWLIAKRGVSTLILVHRKQLMVQWAERLTQFLNLTEKEIGRLGGGRRKLKGKVDIALMQSLVRKGVVDDRVADYGHVIVDECHHVSARNFELAARRAKAKFFLGLSATVERKDGHEPIFFMQCGPVRHTVEAKDQAKARPFRHQVIVRPTGFRPVNEQQDDARVEFQQLCAAITGDPQRNHMIRDDVACAYAAGRHPLVLTERTEHLERLRLLLIETNLPVVVLHGGLSKKDREAAFTLLGGSVGSVQSTGNLPIILATGRFIGEGFDLAKLDTLFVTLPVSWRGTVAQYAGRLHRHHADKHLVQIYDYADLEAPMLARMFDKRCASYESIGYSILLPASALPGWPQSVPLPVDPSWKRQYAVSVKRLIHDGVDVPLAELFLKAAEPPADVPRARSAAEAFLYRRLQSLESTKERFTLNARLPIPFNNAGLMEVDFLFPKARLVVELDGDQHLNDPAAWRIDRRKDRLLQSHGYFILRFLVRDLTGDLPSVLDALLATLDCCLSRATGDQARHQALRNCIQRTSSHPIGRPG